MHCFTLSRYWAGLPKANQTAWLQRDLLIAYIYATDTSLQRTPFSVTDEMPHNKTFI